MSERSESSESYNRVFVLGGKESTKDEFKEVFGKYGEVKDVWMVDDRQTGEFKGVTYITFSKASEAALAIEELNGRPMGSSPKALKVLLANDKKEGNVRDPKEGEKMMRLFIIVPNKYTEKDIKKEFEEYGKVEYVRLIKDRTTGSSKGLAYVKYFRAYHAALALERCDPSFKAVFAMPRSDQPSRSDSKYDDYGGSGYYDMYRERERDRHRYGGSRIAMDNGRDSRIFREYGPPGSQSLLGGLSGLPAIPVSASAHSPLVDLLKNYPTDGGLALEVMAAPGVGRQQLYGLLDMTPGLDYCELDKDSGVAFVQYKTSQLAAYAKEKLGYVEYPPGFRIAVRYPQATVAGSGLKEVSSSLNSSLQSIESGGVAPENLETLVQSIKKATDILQRAGATGLAGASTLSTPSGSALGEERVRYCNVPLPMPKALADRDSPVAERLFIVSQPDSFPQEYLQDVLCRFGGLIDAFFMPGKNFGYAKYASHESAEKAISILHGQQVCHMRLKVMKADPPKYEQKDDGDSQMDSKRPRLA